MKKLISVFLVMAMLSTMMSSVSAADTPEYAWNSWITAAATPDNAARKFTVGDQVFTMLDVNEEDENSTYFITTNQVYSDPDQSYSAQISSKKFTADEKCTKFLNTAPDAEDKGFGDCLPEGMWTYIDHNHSWMTEGASNDTTIGEADYYTTAGVMLPAFWEMTKYGDRYGTQLPDKSLYPVRSPLNATDDVIFVMNPATSSFQAHGFTVEFWKRYEGVNTQNSWQGMKVRPVFYLNNQFFANIRIDPLTAGNLVKEEVKKVGYDVLLEKGTYTENELISYFDMPAPEDVVVLKNVNLAVVSGGSAKYGETLKASYAYSENNANPMQSCEVIWYAGGNQVGTGDEYIVTEADAGKNIYFEVYAYDTEDNVGLGKSVEVSIPALSIEQYNYSAWSWIADIPAAANADDVFELEGQKFTLLDTFNNATSKYYVVANQFYGNGTVSELVMKPTDDTNFAYWLNTTFKEYGNGDTALPKGIINNIDYDHLWLTEGASVWDIDNYTFKAGITIPSLSEMVRYKTKFGFKIGADKGTAYYTRTPANAKFSDNPETKYILCVPATSNSAGFTASNWSVPSTGYIRPQFYLGNDFFKTVKLDLSKAGANVLAVMKANYYVEDLVPLYTKEELAGYGFKQKVEFSANFFSDAGVDNKITELNGATDIYMQATIISNTDKDVYGDVYMALYDGKGELKGVDVVHNIKAGANRSEISMPIPRLTGLTGIDENYYIKAFFWSKELEPLQDAIEFGTEIENPATVAAISSDARGNNFFGESQLS